MAINVKRILVNFNPAPCETCRWWVKWETQLDHRHSIGECRFRAPVTFTNIQTGKLSSKWPSTKTTDYCQEHEAKGGV